MFPGLSKNVCVVGAHSNGKTTICDHLIAFGKLFNNPNENAGCIRNLDARGDEANLGYTIETNAVPVRSSCPIKSCPSSH